MNLRVELERPVFNPQAGQSEGGWVTVSISNYQYRQLGSGLPDVPD